MGSLRVGTINMKEFQRPPMDVAEAFFSAILGKPVRRLKIPTLLCLSGHVDLGIGLR